MHGVVRYLSSCTQKTQTLPKQTPNSTKTGYIDSPVQYDYMSTKYTNSSQDHQNKQEHKEQIAKKKHEVVGYSREPSLLTVSSHSQNIPTIPLIPKTLQKPLQVVLPTVPFFRPFLMVPAPLSACGITFLPFFLSYTFIIGGWVSKVGFQLVAPSSMVEHLREVYTSTLGLLNSGSLAPKARMKLLD